MNSYRRRQIAKIEIMNSMIERGDNPLLIYRYAARNLVLRAVASTDWSNSGLEGLKRFFRNTAPPWACFLMVQNERTLVDNATRIATYSFFRRPEPRIDSVRLAWDSPGVGSWEEAWDQRWASLVTSVSIQLTFLAQINIRVRIVNDAAVYLEVIGGTGPIGDPFRNFPSTLYVAGIDCAWNSTQDRARLEKVKQLKTSLVQLFDGRGKLAFVIGSRLRFQDIHDEIWLPTITL